jgi:hypothetical protein
MISSFIHRTMQNERFSKGSISSTTAQYLEKLKAHRAQAEPQVSSNIERFQATSILQSKSDGEIRKDIFSSTSNSNMGYENSFFTRNTSEEYNSSQSIGLDQTVYKNESQFSLTLPGVSPRLFSPLARRHLKSSKTCFQEAPESFLKSPILKRPRRNDIYKDQTISSHCNESNINESNLSMNTQNLFGQRTIHEAPNDESIFSTTNENLTTNFLQQSIHVVSLDTTSNLDLPQNSEKSFCSSNKSEAFDEMNFEHSEHLKDSIINASMLSNRFKNPEKTFSEQVNITIDTSYRARLITRTSRHEIHKYYKALKEKDWQAIAEEMIATMEPDLDYLHVNLDFPQFVSLGDQNMEIVEPEDEYDIKESLDEIKQSFNEINLNLTTSTPNKSVSRIETFRDAQDDFGKSASNLQASASTSQLQNAQMSPAKTSDIYGDNRNEKKIKGDSYHNETSLPVGVPFDYNQFIALLNWPDYYEKSRTLTQNRDTQINRSQLESYLTDNFDSNSKISDLQQSVEILAEQNPG